MVRSLNTVNKKKKNYNLSTSLLLKAPTIHSVKKLQYKNIYELNIIRKSKTYNIKVSWYLVLNLDTLGKKKLKYGIHNTFSKETPMQKYL